MLVSQKSQRLRKVKIVVFSLIVILLVAGGIYIFWFTELPDIKDISVEGAVLTDVSSLNDSVGENILLWDAPSYLADLPQIKSVDVDKNFIKRSVSVKVSERDKDVIWCLEEKSECFWIDESGVVFTGASNPTGSLIVKVVRDYTERSLSLGDTVLPEDLLVNLRKIFSLVGDLNLSVDEVRIDDLKFKEATAVVVSGPEIYFSLTFDPSFGQGVLDSLSNSSDWGVIRYVDLRVENRAYYSL